MVLNAGGVHQMVYIRANGIYVPGIDCCPFPRAPYRQLNQEAELTLSTQASKHNYGGLLESKAYGCGLAY